MSSAEEKIILATINCIEKYGIDKTTIRLIGKEAGFNSASISYYFRSKDVLMERAMDLALQNAFDMRNFEYTEGMPAKERLAGVFEGMIAGALQFPNITRAFFAELLSDVGYDTPMVRKCSAFLNELEDELKSAYPEKPSPDIRMFLVQAASATFLFPGLFPGFFIGYPEIDFSEESSRKTYVEKLINTYF